jgi:hypothetical protein
MLNAINELPEDNKIAGVHCIPSEQLLWRGIKRNSF